MVNAKAFIEAVAEALKAEGSNEYSIARDVPMEVGCTVEPGRIRVRRRDATQAAVR